VKASTDGGLDPAQYDIGTNLTLTPFTHGLVGYWTFDEGSGTTAYDGSGWGNNGTMYSSTTPSYLGTSINCLRGNCILLNGIDTYIQFLDINFSPDNFNEMTIIMWVHVGSTYLRNPWFYEGVGYSYGAGCSSQKIDFTTYDTNQLTTCSNSVFQNNILKMISYTYSNISGIKAIYIDGGIDSIASGISGQLLDGGNLYFGKIYTSYYTGIIDDVRIYNRALSAAEIQSIYNATR
ncbi:MAG: LamG-like jellyroll fold domain-containing protein, partial [Candidatus Paceibacterota bacterium]